MIIGFTGTRAGLTPGQREQIVEYLELAHHVVHGDCIGADAAFHELALEMGIPVTLHPPVDPSRRAFCSGASAIMPALPYLERNRAIVARSDLLIGAPKETREPIPMRGQGTWSTIRYDRKQRCPLVIVWPRSKGTE